MDETDYSKDEAHFEELFKDRFTEKDSVYSELKSKPLSHPTVVYPWKVKRQWFKSWNYSRDRQNQDRHRSRYNDHDHHQFSNRHRDRSEDGESSRHRDGQRSRYRN
ncbi:uncharacterized protein CDAR_200921 [Caerostris darwini]|uniref:RNA helicase n=1 Tax=Caerostris darwini TaxID=1538125 RepID=A0AAV4SCQ0_9ARAC|nr:uncharacterized protein CDAR_200921 [Caerostris darwini]